MVVAGAGVAGSLFAARLAARGYGVLLLERRRRAELGLDARCLVDPAALEGAGLTPTAPLESCGPPRSFVAVSPDTSTRVPVDRPGLVFVDRRLLAGRLLELAVSSGAEVETECLATGLELEKGGVIGVTSERGTCACTLAVDATGDERSLCRRLSSATGIPRHVRPADCLLLYQESRNAGEEEPEGHIEDGVLNCHYGRFGGYGMTYRDESGRVDVTSAVKGVPWAPDPREIVRGFVRSSLDIGTDLIASAGGRVAARRPLDTMVANGFMLLGDAACQAVPITGRGIAGALAGATLAAEAAATALGSGEAGMEALWSYNRRYIERRGADLAALDCLRIFMQRLSEDEVSRGMATGVFGPREMYMALAGRFDPPSPQARARSMLRAMRDLPLLVRAEAVLRNARRARELYMQYPADYDPPEFAEWRQEASFLFEDVERG